jgi:hypothetical protein
MIPVADLSNACSAPVAGSFSKGRDFIKPTIARRLTKPQQRRTEGLAKAKLPRQHQLPWIEWSREQRSGYAALCSLLHSRLLAEAGGCGFQLLLVLWVEVGFSGFPGFGDFDKDGGYESLLAIFAALSAAQRLAVVLRLDGGEG